MDKQLSYDSLKSVLKHMSLEKREAINRQIPELRTINYRLPYVLETLFIGSFFEINGKYWTFKPTWVQSSENPLNYNADPKKCELTITQYNPEKEARQSMNKSDEEVLEQLFDEYIRDGTVVRGLLGCHGIPEFLKRRRENEVDLKVKATNLQLKIHETEDYEHFIRFIDLDVLENVEFLNTGNAQALLDKPEIKNCKNLIVDAMSLDIPSVNELLRLRNQHLQIEGYRFTRNEVHQFVQDWIITGREIGTRFSWPQRRSEDVVNMLDYLKTHFETLEADSNLESYFSDKTIYGNGTALKMRENRELVMFCGKSNIPSEWTPFTFEMEVVASATGTVPTPDV
ncbi:hypothetical protein CRE_17416 [Caenorhabditis remanei]|uniref:F-box associated domain-containing protein n=1 Tax=Caenorhabditis remanei TaxID=31234 RepID=E3N291_CAERE|nr:hypothetical protein CRE_17416 [Caenorhabditis remanei]